MSKKGIVIAIIVILIAVLGVCYFQKSNTESNVEEKELSSSDDVIMNQDEEETSESNVKYDITETSILVNMIRYL